MCRKHTSHASYRERAERRKPGDPHTIPSFCASNGISLSLYYTLRGRGLGPIETKLGSKRIVISPQAAADWLAEREAASRRAHEAAADESKARAEAEPSDNELRTRSEFNVSSADGEVCAAAASEGERA
jgi:hypothetical protein